MKAVLMSGFGGVEVMANATHVAADGRRYHVTHGDNFDLVVRHARCPVLMVSLPSS